MVERDTLTHRIRATAPPGKEPGEPVAAASDPGLARHRRDVPKLGAEAADIKAAGGKISEADSPSTSAEANEESGAVRRPSESLEVSEAAESPAPSLPALEQPRRAAQGGRIDRSAPLRFTFDGIEYGGYQGDTLASALLANGVRRVGRSFKYHRPRGILGIGAEEPNALVRLGEGAYAAPNHKATEVELFDGLVAHSQNRWPSRDFDIGVLADFASRLLPAGFYYKTFMWPGSWWRFYERFIRKAAGLGRSARAADPDAYDHRHAFCDVLVVGAGPAGLMAAQAAAESGARTILIDDAAEPGGELLATDRAIAIDGLPPASFTERTLETLRSRSNLRIIDRTCVFGYYDDNMLVALERVSDHLPPSFASKPPYRQRLWWIRAKEVVSATGAVERPLVFENNDRPGVMLAGAAKTLACRYAVRLGERAVIFTNNDSAYQAIPPLQASGVRILAVVDARAQGPGGASLALLGGGSGGDPESGGDRAIELITGSAVSRAVGADLRAVEVRALSEDGAALGNESRRIECDLLCISGGWSPNVHLFSQSGGRLRFDETIAAFVPGSGVANGRIAGAAGGRFGLEECLSDGIAAGLDAARAAGFDSDAAIECPPVDEPEPEPGPESIAPLRPLWAVPMPEGRRGKRFVDFQNDVTVADIELAAQEGYDSVEHLKRYTTAGMGTDQGRTGNVNALALLAKTRGEPIPAVGITTFRPPLSPTALGAIAGHRRGLEIAPIRRSPIHDRHVALGAVFVPAGLWMRPQFYPQRISANGFESPAQAIAREALAVRRKVGIVDVSTLGKIAVQGPDAGEFLHRVYINRIRNLAVGRCRYAFMLREDGFILDDGTVTRIAEDDWYLTTSTGHAAAVLAHLERYAQIVWPQSRVQITDVGDQWGAVTLAGPEARALLGKALDDGADVCDAALPMMACIEACVAGVPVRIIRMSFSGERSYELHCPADHAPMLWDALLEAGEEFGVEPYGTEALGTLRIEKGHVVAAELDGRTIPADFGFDRMEKNEDFIGRRSLERFRRAGSDGGGEEDRKNKRKRKRLVGLVSTSDRAIPRGGQLVWNPTAPAPVPMFGHVTSICHSPTLDRPIALALIDDEPEDRPSDRGEWKGAVICVASPLESRFVQAKICDPVFVDPENSRSRG
ncbi:MAG: sarcosine oxidase subunit alpha family protein [Ectothiorhodospiraceae bacterium AqS1]|nr:sarcosine oxidase subunit alpha family protein [Ectothiorhodospiraceae bacterium AqS1]